MRSGVPKRLQRAPIVVTPLSRLQDAVDTYRPARVISLMSKPGTVPNPAGLPPNAFVEIAFNDVVDETVMAPGIVPPAVEHVEALLDIARGWDGAAPLLIHCWFGISRSPAAAFSIACALSPGRAPGDIAGALRAASPSATPNARLVRVADDHLGREGAMVSAIRDIGRGGEASEGDLFELAV